MNVVKHAKAKDAIVKLSSNADRVRIEVTDNGRGFDRREAFHPDISGGGFGLFSIREQAAALGRAAYNPIQTRPGNKRGYDYSSTKRPIMKQAG